jgi:hypothetical protein
MRFFDDNEMDNLASDFEVDESGCEVEYNDEDDFCGECDEHLAFCLCDGEPHDLLGGEDSFLDSFMEGRMMGEY